MMAATIFIGLATVIGFLLVVVYVLNQPTLSEEDSQSDSSTTESGGPAS